jgi:hypothetical protein
MRHMTNYSCRYEHRWPEGQGKLICVVTIEYGIVNDRLEAQTLTVRMNSTPVTTSIVRALPIGAWMAEDRRLEVRSAGWEQFSRGLTSKDRAKLRRRIRAATHARAGRPKITRDLLQEVADVYRRAHERGDPPTQAVADHFPTPRSTAAKWVQRAREEGFLGKTEERRAGEQPTKRKATKR